MAKGNLRMAAHRVPIVEDSSTNGENKLRRSWWSVHEPELGSPEKSYRRQGVPKVVVTPERLCNDYNATKVRHGHWMGCRN